MKFQTLSTCRFLILAAALPWSMNVYASRVWSDGPADNVPDNVRPIPPMGLELKEEAKRELLSGAEKLEREAQSLTVAQTDRSEVLVFARAVRLAVADSFLYTEKEVEYAYQMLKLGQDRLQVLKAGKIGAQLIGCSVEPTAKAQLLVGGFRSRIDGSIQPYGLVLPADTKLTDGQPRRLDVWLHGRGEKVSEVAFLQQRLQNAGEIAPANTIVLHPYGRYCNAFKFAGEIDVLEAIEHVKSLFKIDENRISIRGFSMGGAGCWQMAVHYPGMWMAATPGAGFSETTEFLKVFQQEDFKPTPTQQSLLHWYDCPDWANNLRNLPIVAYSGEIDRQKQAADVMVAACKQRGFELRHVIGPQTAHKIHPDAKEELEQFLQKTAATGRLALPRNIDFTTYSLRYAKHTWLTIEGLKEHWQESRIQASIPSNQAIDITTKNVTAFSMDLPKDAPILKLDQPIDVRVDGTLLRASSDPSLPRWRAEFAWADGKWTSVVSKSATASGLRKRPGLQGPIDDAFLDAFVFVGPDSAPAAGSAVDAWLSQEFAHAKREWQRHYRGDIVQRTAQEVTPADIADNNLILFGTPDSNPLIAKVMQGLPIRREGTDWVLGDKRYSAQGHVPVLIYPNPLNPDRYVVLNSGFTFREYAYLNNARQIPMLPDWAMVSATEGRNAQQPGKIVAAGFFDEQWRVK